MHLISKVKILILIYNPKPKMAEQHPTLAVLLSSNNNFTFIFNITTMLKCKLCQCAMLRRILLSCNKNIVRLL